MGGRKQLSGACTTSKIHTLTRLELIFRLVWRGFGVSANSYLHPMRSKLRCDMSRNCSGKSVRVIILSSLNPTLLIQLV